jgi:hypothetical protein
VELRRQPHKATALRKQPSPLGVHRVSSQMHQPADMTLMSGHNSPMSVTATGTPVSPDFTFTPMSTLAGAIAAETSVADYSYATSLATTLRASPPAVTAAIAAAISAVDPFGTSMSLHPGVLSPAPTPPAVSPIDPSNSPLVSASPPFLGLAEVANDKRAMFDALAVAAAASAVAVTSGAINHLGHAAQHHQQHPFQSSMGPSFQPLPPQSFPLASSPLSSSSHQQQAWMNWPATAFSSVPMLPSNDARHVSLPDMTSTPPF